MFGELLDCTVDWTAVVQVSCLAAPPAAPAGATSNWDGSSNTAGTSNGGGGCTQPQQRHTNSNHAN